MNLAIPSGWFRVALGEVVAGDKFWSPTFNSWLPIVKGDKFWGKRAEAIPTRVIRKDAVNT